MSNKNRIHFKDFCISKGGTSILVIASGIATIVSVTIPQPQWLGIIVGVVIYSSAMSTAIYTINKRDKENKPRKCKG